MSLRPMVGVFGGTFDPIHYGHLRTVRETAVALALERVIIVPCGMPYHRLNALASATERLDMTRLAVAHDPLFIVDDREIASSDPCYSVCTLAALRREQPGRTFCLIIGQDSFLSMTRWYQWPRLFELGHVVVMSRPGVGGAPDPELWRHARRHSSPETLSMQRSGVLFEQRVHPQPMSASEVRQAVSEGRSIAHLVPPEVESYIHEHQLYV
ncbi:MAG: nicotinate-nucleotide adenylyltransferase [Acidiferrobacteraceae bacterium]